MIPTEGFGIAKNTNADCGWYGCSDAFDNNHRFEVAHLETELSKAKKFLKQQCRNVRMEERVEIECYIEDFHEFHRVALS